MFISSVLIGAPRAQSTLEAQRKVNETGAVYKCSFDKSSTANCAPFVFDAFGNFKADYNQYTHDNEKKDHQWLGASMDGNENDGEKFVVSLLFQNSLSLCTQSTDHFRKKRFARPK